MIDGGNSYYRDDIRRAKRLAEDKIHYVDTGTSGGVWGLDRGYCLMIGGPDEAVETARPDLRHARPGRRVSRAHARPGRATRRPRSRATCTAVPTARATS